MSTPTDISIIIPTYNLEAYIGATLESVLLQQGLSLEILVIDDGSTDATVSIVQKYAQKFPHIKLLKNEKSKGVSGARNTGLAHMQGKFCFFLDGDDLLLPHALAPLHAYMCENATPIVGCLGQYFCHQRWILFKVQLSSSTESTFFPTASFTHYLYDSSFLKKHAITFPEHCTRGEDRTFFCQVFCKVNHIHTIEHDAYFYRINHKENLFPEKHALSYLEHFNYIYAILKENNKEAFFPSYIQTQFCTIWLQYLFCIVKKDPQKALPFMHACSKILSPMQNELSPVLENDLKEHSTAFWQACQKNDAQAMLHVVQKNNLLIEPSIYTGIETTKITPMWKWVRPLHRAKNLLSNPVYMKSFLYLITLKLKAKKRMYTL